MKKNIYLFCNETYGSAYLKVFQEYAQKLSEFECYVVFSLKGENRGFLGKLIAMIRDPFKYAHICYRQITLYFNGLSVLTVDNVNDPDFADTIPFGSFGFIAGFNQIFGKSVIERFFLFINFHPSLLPYYRGAIPSYWVIKNKETSTGFTAHTVSEKIDAGAIIYQESVKVTQDISEMELDNKIATAGAYYFSECLEAIMMGKQLRRRRINPQYLKEIDYVSSVRE